MTATVRFPRFVERVFGVPVDARVLSIGPKRARIRCHFQGHTWVQWIRLTREVYYPRGHPMAREPFFLAPNQTASEERA